MKASGIRRIFAATFAAALTLPAVLKAEDIDIFTAGSGVTSKPNILIILDSSSNWSATLGNNTCMSSPGGNMNANTKFAAEACALYNVVGGLDSSVRLGLMMFAETGNNGAYVRFGMRDMNAQNKAAFQNLLRGIVPSGSGTDNSGSNQPYAKTMFEAFKYFGGYTCPAHATDNVAYCGGSQSQTSYGFQAFAGGNDNDSGTFRRDFRNNNTPANRSASYYNADNNTAFDSGTNNFYTNPIVDNCAKNFIVFISNGNPGTGGDSSVSPARDTALLTNIGATTQAIPNAANEIHASKMDEMALFLYQTDVSAATGQQRVLTYTIAVYQPQSITYAADGVTVTSETILNTDQQMIKLMKSAANVGGGKYFAARRAQDVVDALLQIINEVQAVNSVFVSASLPVSVNNQGTFLNQVYMGMFRPDGTGNPRWMGNLKEYKFILDPSSGAISLADANSQPVINTATGFITPGAQSFWTRRGNNPGTPGWPNRDFWINNPTGTPASGSDSPDGEVVEKGGAAEMQRIDYAASQASRVVFTCPLPLATGCSGNESDMNTATRLFTNTVVAGASYQTAFGAASATELSSLVDWIRGQDNFNGAPCDPSVSPCAWTSAELGPGWSATVRPSIHGDVLHSRPVVLNYPPGSTNPGPWVFYGSGDGTLRAVKGGQSPSTDGHESWAFVAPEFYGRFKRLKAASPELRTPGTPALLINSTLPKDYFFDGPIGVWEDPDSDANNPTKWIFVTARRGGALIYAFDVTNPTAPKFKWKKSATDLPNLGQTWSTPWAFKRGDRVFLLFGAGYDTGEDSSPAVPNGNIGRGLYVLNADDGSTISGGDVGSSSPGFWQRNASTGATIADSVPSDVSLLVNAQGNVYRGYFGDTGGNMWRIDIPDDNVGHWKLFKFATLGPGRKFFYGPDIVHSGSWDVVLAGTGDREKPLVTTSQDAFYALNDVNANPATVPATAPAVLIVTNLVQLTSTSGITSGNGGTCTGGICICQPPACNGWYRLLSLGEKVVNSPLTVAGTTYFSTNKPTPPAAGTCSANLGQARAYGFTFFGGAPNHTQPDGTMGTPLTGGGLPPSPVGGVVEISPGKEVAFIIGAGDKGSSVEGGRITVSVAATRRKVYWNQSTD